MQIDQKLLVELALLAKSNRAEYRKIRDFLWSEMVRVNKLRNSEQMN